MEAKTAVEMVVVEDLEVEVKEADSVEVEMVVELDSQGH